MTTYNFIADPAHTGTYWSNPAVWQGGVVPSGAGAAVVIPTIYTSSNSIYTSHIDTLGTAVSIGQLFMANNVLEVGGAGGAPSLAVGGTVQLVSNAQITVNNAGTFTIGGLLDVTSTASVDLTNTIDANGSTSLGSTPATMTAGSVENAGTIDALGSITASGSFTNEAGSLLEAVANADASSLTISVKSFDNAGKLWAQSGSLTVTTGAGGLENLLGGTLAGGTYEVGNVNPASPSSNTAGDLYLQGGSALATLSAQLTLGIGSDVFSYNGSAYQPLEATLQTITSSGTLSLIGGAVANWGSWDAFTDNGVMQLNGGSLTTPQLTIGSGGTLDANGQIIGAVVDNGTLVVGLPQTGSAAEALDITGAVSGLGTVTFVPEAANSTHYERTLEFGAASSANVKFGDVYGTLVLDDPAQFTGVITPFAPGIQQQVSATSPPAGDQIQLPGVALSDLTGYTYSGNATGGTLTLDFGPANSTISLNFDGDLTAQSFSFTNDQPLSTSPPTLVITAVPLDLITSNVLLQGQDFSDGPVEIMSGATLQDGTGLSTGQLTIDRGGTYDAGGTTAGPVVDNGTIALTGDSDEFGDLNLSVTFTGALAGSGSLLFAGVQGYYQYEFRGDQYYFTYAAPEIELKSSASVNIAFADDWGTLTLDDPSQFTGSITPSDLVPTNGASASSNFIDLANVPGNTVESYSYSGNSTGGTLTIQLNAGAPLSLRFIGDFTTQSFAFYNLTTASPLTIYVQHFVMPHNDFQGPGVSDILLENFQGQVEIGQLTSGAFALTQIDTLSAQWKFVGNGDFYGDNTDQILIENAAGNLGVGFLSGSTIQFYTVATGLAASSKFVETGYFLGNGAEQFILETASGQIDLGTISGTATLTQVDTLGSQWTFVGAGDYLGAAGVDQVAIENTAGSVGIGTVTGSSITFKTVGALTASQHIVETGDFYGNGSSDFLIDNTTTGALDVGEVVNGALFLSQIDTLGPQWRFVGAGDYLGDGKDQILIENTSASLGIGEVSNGSIHFTTAATFFGEWVFH